MPLEMWHVTSLGILTINENRDRWLSRFSRMSGRRQDFEGYLALHPLRIVQGGSGG